MSFEQWKQDRLLKAAKKKTRKVLMKQGFTKSEANQHIKGALRRIVNDHEQPKPTDSPVH